MRRREHGYRSSTAMNTLSSYDITVLFMGIALMLGSGRLLGELFRRLRLPPVAGEILAGIIIGPSLLGRLSPGFFQWIFPAATRGSTAMEAIVYMGVVFLLLVAGLEVDLSSVLKQGKTVFTMSAFNIALPFAFGFSFAFFAPGFFGGQSDLVLALFVGVALSITALPIIAKILMDMRLFHTDFGMLVLASAMVNDLFGWIVFSVIVQLASTGALQAAAVARTAALSVLAAVAILTAVRALINQALPWIERRTEWPGGVIAFVVSIALVCSAVTEAIGIHAILGAFLAGIAIGDSPHLRAHTRDIINQFINNIFAPIFFVSIGLRVDFIGNFDPALTLALTALAFGGKFAGSLIGGRLSGLPVRQSLLTGSAMSALGVMGIIIGLTALRYGIIEESAYVSIVVMALATSLLSGPLIRAFLPAEAGGPLTRLIDASSFLPRLAAATPGAAIRELAAAAALKTGLDSALIAGRALERESIMSTGLDGGIAVPHARMAEIGAPSLTAGLSPDGIDFDAPDGGRAHIVFLILTPAADPDSQIAVLAEISRVFADESIKRLALRAADHIEFIRIIETARAQEKRE
ncbi:MAG TPA: cation:proton antiporter [Spirochaetota bacterium]|nr:cation:proton antiporter [Spirochaetota bacterium]OPZ38281.1 MAG: High-affinity Na(+)/H(+) antiporter NhaS3 [Spirochaetes bacterium ADurb.BinA120]HNU91203.1 cation:proton antiporter [Spirochaetota bacterium]HPI14092.1 cation:proton antiporter [Spirochaetota bacterium]HPV97835.1 cation:proton antiporter [Spirochaetota bacterium]